MIFEKLKAMEPFQRDPEKLDRTMYMEDGSIWAKSGGLLKFYILPDEEDPLNSVIVEMDSMTCGKMCWYDWEMDGVGSVAEMLFGGSQVDAVATWMLQNGIAFGQSFWLDMSFGCGETQSMDSVWPEYWSEVDYEVVEVEPLPGGSDAVAESWEAYIGRMYSLL